MRFFQLSLWICSILSRRGRYSLAVFFLLLQLIGAQGLLSSAEAQVDAPFIRGDCNQDGSLTIADPVLLLNHLFPANGQSSAPLDCHKACDVDDNGALSAADPVILLFSMFNPGHPTIPIAEPVGACGYDPTPDALTCSSSYCPSCISSPFIATHPEPTPENRWFEEMISFEEPSVGCRVVVVGQLGGFTPLSGGFVRIHDESGSIVQDIHYGPNTELDTLVEVPGGDFLVAGREAYGFPNSFAHVRRLTADGQTVWTFTGTELYTRVKDILINQAGEVLLLEETFDNAYIPHFVYVRMALRRLSLSNGQELGRELIPTEVYGRGMIELSNGDRIVVGRDIATDASAMMRIAPGGTIVWQTINTTTAQTDRYLGVVNLPNGEFAALRNTSFHDAIEVYTEDGTFRWSKHVPYAAPWGTANAPLHRVVFSPTDSTIVVNGLIYLDQVVLAKFDLAGNPLWTEFHGGLEPHQWVTLSSTIDGGFYLGGTISWSSLYPGDENFLMKVNSSGTLVP